MSPTPAPARAAGAGVARWVTVHDLAAGGTRLALGLDGAPDDHLHTVDLDRVAAADDDALDRAVHALDAPGLPIVGVSRAPWTPASRRIGEHLTVTVTTDLDPPSWAVTVPDADAALDQLSATVAGSPRAAAVLGQILRVTPGLDVPEALVVESFAYSMLLAGPEFRRWRQAAPRREPPAVAGPVRLRRDGDRLTVTLDHPARRNAYSRPVRDGLVEALEVVAADPSLRQVRLEGNGPAFCSGGDLDEFGTMPDVAAAHLVRLRQGAGAALHRVADRVVVQLHGACVGAGIEIPAFAGRVLAAPDTAIRLPELAMGLIPGAGGTVSLPRRIGRWRTAFLALTGAPLTAAEALRWGLVDAVTDARGDPATGGRRADPDG